MNALVAPVFVPTPGRCGAAQFDHGPRCGASPTQWFACGERCRAHRPANRKTGKPEPYLRLLKETR